MKQRNFLRRRNGRKKEMTNGDSDNNIVQTKF